MKRTSTQGLKKSPLFKLTAFTLIFLGLSTHTHLDAATTWKIAPPPHPSLSQKIQTSPETKENSIHVLSPKDAALYQSAFASQEKGDAQAADIAIAQIENKNLVGHVLAERYLQNGFTLTQAKLFMASYGDLPEAPALYEKARHLNGFSAASIRGPHLFSSWSGKNELSASSDFHSQRDTGNVLRKNHVGFKINAALRQGNPLKANELLTAELNRGALSIDASREIVSHIAASFYYEGDIAHARSMAHLAANAGDALGLWIEGLVAWKQNDFTSATRSFASLTQVPGLSSWDQAAASYWAYRSAARTGDKVQAHHWLQEAAKSPRTFYGYMAANLVSKHPDQWPMPELNAHNIAVLAQYPAGFRALALVQINRNDLAEGELRHIGSMESRDLQTATLALAERAHISSVALQLSGVALNDKGELYEGALYPLPSWKPVNGFKVDRALMYALIRDESQFDPKAVSVRGACGLMQIMPSTAARLTTDEGTSNGRHCPVALLDPSVNMEMGQKYVRLLAGEPMIGNNLVLLLAAYNGGPGNVAHWLDNNTHNDPLLFLESMPLRETRDYVQQVLLHYWMYRSRLSESDTAVAQLSRGEWPRYALNDDYGLEQVKAPGIEMASVNFAKLNRAH